MLKALSTLFICLVVGNAIARLTGLPLPGPVIGLLILLALLARQGGPDHSLRMTGGALLQNMSILFVPAGVGLINALPILARDALPISISIVVSTTLGMIVTASVMRYLTRERQS